MPVPTRVQPEKNIWIAAGDGDLDRVRDLIENESMSPNVPDLNTYTPMHAAASYGHIPVLEYLFSKGGDVNVTDSDGDTPLYVVENIETAKWLTDHGAVIDRQNLEGQTPAAYLSEDFPEVAAYLESLHPTTTATPATYLSGDVPPIGSQLPSQHAQNQASEQLTSDLIASVGDIMQRAEAEGRDCDEELREAVGRTVLEGVVAGYGMSNDSGDQDRRTDDVGNGSKRPRTDGGE